MHAEFGLLQIGLEPRGLTKEHLLKDNQTLRICRRRPVQYANRNLFNTQGMCACAAITIGVEICAFYGALGSQEPLMPSSLITACEK